MRFVQVKSAEQQSRLMLHRTRDLLMRQRTQLINALRAHMAELGIMAAQGRDGIKELLRIIASEQDARLPVDAHASLVVLAAGLQALQTMIGSIEKRIVVQHRSDEASTRMLKLARQQPEKYPWLTRLLARRPFRMVAVALANKMARIAWALLAKGGTYRMPVLAAAA
jgi:transposase